MENATCTKEDESFLETLDDDQQAFERCGMLECLMKDDERSIFPCLAECFEKIVDKKITPKCMQCWGGIFTCGSKQCGTKCSTKYLINASYNSKVPIALCLTCFTEKCEKKAVDCGLSDKAMRPTARAMSPLF